MKEKQIQETLGYTPARVAPKKSNCRKLRSQFECTDGPLGMGMYRHKTWAIGTGAFNDVWVYDSPTPRIFRVSKDGSTSRAEIELTQFASDKQIGPRLVHVYEIASNGSKWKTAKKTKNTLHLPQPLFQIDDVKSHNGFVLQLYREIKLSPDQMNRAVTWKGVSGAYRAIPRTIIIESEKLDGDLKHWMQSKPTAGQVTKMSESIDALIGAAAEVLFFHGDIKCENILFSKKNHRVVFTDFDDRFCCLRPTDNGKAVSSALIKYTMTLLLILELRCEWDLPVADELARNLQRTLKKPKRMPTKRIQSPTDIVNKVFTHVNMYARSKHCIDVSLVDEGKFQWHLLTDIAVPS